MAEVTTSEKRRGGQRATRLVIVAGKGGVGKTTVAAALALAAHDAGQRVLVVELDGKPTIAEHVASHSDSAVSTPPVEVVTLSAAGALDDYLSSHGFGMIARRLRSSGAIEVIASAAPGIYDLVTLGKIKQYVNEQCWDLIVVDGPAAGHAITLLTSPVGVADAISGGPVRRQADQVVDLLHDHVTTEVALVTLPQHTPASETIDTFAQLTTTVGVRCTHIIVNRYAADATAPDRARTTVLDGPSTEVNAAHAAAAYSRNRRNTQRHAVAYLTDGLATLDRSSPGQSPQVTVLPELPSTIGPPATEPTSESTSETSRIEQMAAHITDALPTLLGLPANDRSAVTPDTTTSTPTVDTTREATVGDGAAPVGHSMPQWGTHAKIIVCCGAGGVGKTTVSGALGMLAARSGRRVCVVTIDPARRLADALGMGDTVGNEPHRIDLAPTATTTEDDGEMWAMMLDPAAVLHRLVHEHAADATQAERITTNPIFSNIATKLSGTQEYMATEVIHQLSSDDRFDLVIVDTPPSRHALHFLDAPAVLTRFLSHPIFTMMMLPTRGGLRLINRAARPIMNTIGKVIGSDVLADSVAFFQAFSGMEVGFRERSAHVSELLRAATTSYVIVTTHEAMPLAEAHWCTEQLEAHQITPTAFVANQLPPRFGSTSAQYANALAERSVADNDPTAAALWRNLAASRHAADIAQLAVAGLTTYGTPVHPIWATTHDVHSIGTLELIANNLGTTKNSSVLGPTVYDGR